MDAKDLYSDRTDEYLAYVSAFRHKQGLQAVLRASQALGPGQRILDAGCGTGLSTFALIAALGQRGLDYATIDAFDLTPAMLARFQDELARTGTPRVTLKQADVLRLDVDLPPSWSQYDLIVSACMLEYVPRTKLAQALGALRERLAPGGRLIVFMTRREVFFTRLLWHCEGYTRREFREILAEAGYSDVALRSFPWSHGWLNFGLLVAEAR